MALTRAFVFVGLLAGALADDNDHMYSPNEAVTLWVNTVGPYHNPQETYPYYDLPYCKPDHGIDTKRRPSSIGEVLEGNELRNSGFKLHFGVDVEREVVCDTELDAADAAHFQSAIDQQYWYELYLDDLPMWGMVGEILRDESTGQMVHHIFTHRSLSLTYNENRILEVNLTSENPVAVEAKKKMRFTYSVHWKKSNKEFASRFNRYLEYDFFEHQIHWFSIFNSFMMVVFLCGLVALILLRTLRNDFARYAKGELDGDDAELGAGLHGLGEDSGWKQVHGDVFRAPEHLELFSAMVGTGWQLIVLILGVVLWSIAGPVHGYMYEDRGKMASAFIVCFALSSAVSGYASGSYYKQYFTSPRAEQASQWQKTMVLSIILFPGLVVAISAGLNTVAVYYDTVNAMPVMVIFKMVGIWLFVALPLAVVGTIFGRHLVGKVDTPCRVNSIPRPIPLPPWYAAPEFVIPVSGLLPFGSIFIEMYFIFTSFWSYKFYYVYGFMLLVYGILAMVTVCTSIVGVYFVLNAENYHWQWISYMSAGSTSMYVFLYSVYYFFFKTQMTGFLQVSFYFGYMFLFSVALFFICGTFGMWGASVFVRKIYRDVKID